MKQIAVVCVALLAACGGKQPAPTTGNTSTTESTTVPAPVIPAAWESLGAGTVEADLDGDGKPETLTVAGDEYAKTLSIDGAPYTCATETTSEFDHIQIVDMEPTMPGLEISVSGHLSDADYAHCYITKIGGELEVLAIYNSRVEGNLILADGNCQTEPTAYTRVATGFEEHAELIGDKMVGVNCCDGPDCP